MTDRSIDSTKTIKEVWVVLGLKTKTQKIGQIIAIKDSEAKATALAESLSIDCYIEKHSVS